MVISRQLGIVTAALLLLSSCGKTTASQIEASKERMRPLISYMDSMVADKWPLPHTQTDLEKEYLARSKAIVPETVIYVQMDNRSYKLVEYLRGRTALIFVSKDEGSQHRGWWLDDDSGEFPQEVP